MHPFRWLLFLLVLALSPLAAAQGDNAIDPGEHAIEPGTYKESKLRDYGFQNPTVTPRVTSDVSVDVYILVGGNRSALAAGDASVAWSALNTTSTSVDFNARGVEAWLVIDNSDDPVDGARGQTVAQVTFVVTVYPDVIFVPNQNTLWRSLMFTAHYWDIQIIGVGGVALWMLVFAGFATYGFRSPLSRLAIIGGGVAGLTFLWALVPHPGMISQVGFPLLIGAGAGYLSAQAVRTMPPALRMAVLASVLGSILGLTIGHYLHATWSDSGMFVLGGERFLDALFTVPVAAFATAALMKIVPAIVTALEDDEAADAGPANPGLGTTFNVNCLRCGTSITVNRSVKRYLVATDRYEFPCPNCHAWMEWAEPKPAAAA